MAIGKRAICSCVAAAALVLVMAVSASLVAQETPQAPQGLAAAKVGDVVKLPAPSTAATMTVEQALAKRRSVRSFADTPLTLEQVSTLLWAAQGVTDPSTGHRTAPSARAKYPLEVYAVLPEGVFKYVPADHAMKKVTDGDQRAALAGQKSVATAGMDIVFTAVPTRMGEPSEQRTTWVAFEAGAAAENTALEAVALGLASVVVGGYDAEKLTQALALPAEEKPVIILAIGKPAGAVN